jgi:hypothetical protein
VLTGDAIGLVATDAGPVIGLRAEELEDETSLIVADDGMLEEVAGEAETLPAVAGFTDIVESDDAETRSLIFII